MSIKPNTKGGESDLWSDEQGIGTGGAGLDMAGNEKIARWTRQVAQTKTTGAVAMEQQRNVQGWGTAHSVNNIQAGMEPAQSKSKKRTMDRKDLQTKKYQQRVQGLSVEVDAVDKAIDDEYAFSSPTGSVQSEW
jgi:hypothetical protein